MHAVQKSEITCNLVGERSSIGLIKTGMVVTDLIIIVILNTNAFRYNFKETIRSISIEFAASTQHSLSLFDAYKENHITIESCNIN